jgi:hypothetical protein
MSRAMSRAISKPIFGLALISSAALVLLAALSAQDAPKTAPTPAADYAAIPVPEAKQANPVKSTPESLTRAKKSWAPDCAMCHPAAGDGKGSLAIDTKLTLADFTDPSMLKDRTERRDFLPHRERPSGHAS